MRYYFHLNEHAGITRDSVGADLPDTASARHFAIQEARIVMCSSIKAGQLHLDDYVEIADRAGPLFMLRFGDAVRVTGRAAEDAGSGDVGHVTRLT